MGSGSSRIFEKGPYRLKKHPAHVNTGQLSRGVPTLYTSEHQLSRIAVRPIRNTFTGGSPSTASASFDCGPLQKAMKGLARSILL